MAERRMFAKTIIDSDIFLDMPLSAQCLYFHLAMRADDDGFLNNVNRIMRTVGVNKDDYNILLVRNFVIQFDDGICVIKHWRIHNYIQNDRYHETNHTDKKELLSIANDKAYTLDKTNKKLKGNKIVERNLIENNKCIQDGYISDTQSSLGKVRLGKDSLDNKYSSKDESSTKVLQGIYRKVIDYLNLKTNKSFKATSKENQRLIKARYNEGYSLEDFCKVIDNKCGQWLNNPDMDKYLRPKTLFGTKFESYLNEKTIKIEGQVNKNKGSGFNNFTGRDMSERYQYLQEQMLLRQATEEEIEEFNRLRGENNESDC